MYDGGTTAAPVLASFDGYVYGTAIFSTGSTMLINFNTDGSITYTGFYLTWTDYNGGNSFGFNYYNLNRSQNLVQWLFKYVNNIYVSQKSKYPIAVSKKINFLFQKIMVQLNRLSVALLIRSLGVNKVVCFH